MNGGAGGGGGGGGGVSLDGCSSSDASGCYSPHELFYHQQQQQQHHHHQQQQQQQQHHHNHQQQHQLQQHHHQQQQQQQQQRSHGPKLSLPPIERYDEALSCCLPPPSPAPNSDRCLVVGAPMATPPGAASALPCDGSCADTFECGGPAAAAPPKQPQQISLSSSSLSLGTNGGASNSTHSSRTSTSGSGGMHSSPSGRYGRLTSPPTVGVSRYAPHFGAAAAAPPLLSSDTYAYLASTVHTPVKRYVPTPPPLAANELGLYGPAKAAAFHMKCCLSEPHQPHQVQHGAAEQPDGGGSDYYDTLPQAAQRQRGLGCDKYCGGGKKAPATCRPMATRYMGGDMVAQAPPAEYAPPPGAYKKSVSSGCMDKARGGSSAAATDGDGAGQIGGSYDGAAVGGAEGQPAKGATAATCLHCNTVRRTTGVHQTTQTTGPISPIPSLPHVTAAPHNQYGGGCDGELAGSLPAASGELRFSPMAGSPPQGKAVTQQQQQQHHQQPPLQQQQQHHLQQAATLEQPAGLPQDGQQPSAAAGNMPQQQMPQQQLQQPQQQLPQPQPANLSRKKRFSNYVRREIAVFFGIDEASELEEYAVWQGRQRRFAVRRFGQLKADVAQAELSRSLCHGDSSDAQLGGSNTGHGVLPPVQHHHQHSHVHSERPDILPAQDSQDNCEQAAVKGRLGGEPAERKPSVAAMLVSCLTYIVHALHTRRSPAGRAGPQWSRSIAPRNVTGLADGEMREGVRALQEEELFFDTPSGGTPDHQSLSPGISPTTGLPLAQQQHQMADRAKGLVEHGRPMYIVGERLNGWRTSVPVPVPVRVEHVSQQKGQPVAQPGASHSGAEEPFGGLRGKRISPQLLDGVLENSRRPLHVRVRLYAAHELDDRPDYRPFFTYWLNTVQILVVLLSIVCYGVGPLGVGVEQRTGQVLVTSLSLQTVQHTEQRNIWLGPRNNDLVHMGAKFATCMRRDVKIMNVLLKTRRQERETACCIRNDDSGCVQSSQADCSVRGLFPTKSISTWKKWSPGESGPGGRISGSVCGLDPKYCDAPASIAPYEWPDDITKWPICRKTNSFSHRFRYKDHTAEHMVCEVIGHPCCTGVYGECRITTREYCDFVNGYFHEEASLCSQISCLNNVCGMFPFLSVEVPDQFYRLFTSLCLHAGVLHLVITVAFQHVYLADLERLIGPLRTAIVYIGAGLAGNLTSAVLVPYKPEVGPLASLVGVVASLAVLLIFIHWKHLRKPYVALFKLLLMGAFLFAVGTLPWQLNFAGLIAGTLCASILTIALVPFVSINKYKRKSKINLIWFCIIIHSILYSIMFVVFYVFPMELTNFNFGEIFNNNFNPIVISNSADYISSSMSNKNARYPSMQQQQQPQPPQQHYYHHQSNDIINNAASLADGSNLAVNKFV